MQILDKQDVKVLITRAIDEDINTGDVTSQAIFKPEHKSTATIIAKDSGVWCGGFMLEYVYSFIDPSVKIKIKFQECDEISQGDILAEIQGPTISILEGERIGLNFLQRMCGIATRAHAVSQLLADTSIKILDTRKTVPGYRALDKYAVRCGGGVNHRMGLFDMVMIKDNHIRAAGSIKAAVECIRKAYGHTYRIEVETTNLKEVQDAVDAGADIIMLDNMNKVEMAEAVRLISGNAEIEVSGTVDEKKLKEYKGLDVNFISMGALTHSVRAFDLSMKFS